MHVRVDRIGCSNPGVIIGQPRAIDRHEPSLGRGYMESPEPLPRNTFGPTSYHDRIFALGNTYLTCTMIEGTTVDYEGLRLLTEQSVRGRSRSEVARERHLSPQAVSAACNTANGGVAKLQIRLIEHYTDLRIRDLGSGRFQIEQGADGPPTA